MSRGGSRRGDHRREEFTADGWNVAGGSSAAPRPPAKAGDLTNFGKISKSGTPSTFGPSSVFSKKESKGRDAPPPLSRASSNANMFSMLGDGASEPPTATSSSSRAPSRKPSIDLGPGGIPETAPPSVRKKLALLPRTVAAEDAEGAEPPKEEEEEEETPTTAEPSITEDQANARISEDVKEFWNGRNLDEAVLYFEPLPDQYKYLLVSKFVETALDKKEADVILVADLFSKVADASTCPADAFEKGLLSTVEGVDDLSVDVPKAYSFVARLLKGSKLPQDTIETLASKIIVDGDPLKPPRDKLLGELAKLEG